MDLESRVNEVLDKLRPFLINDGGNLDLVKIEDGVVYVKFIGSCATCPMRQMTLNEGIKDSLLNEIDEIVDVKLV